MTECLIAFVDLPSRASKASEECGYGAWVWVGPSIEARRVMDSLQKAKRVSQALKMGGKLVVVDAKNIMAAKRRRIRELIQLRLDEGLIDGGADGRTHSIEVPTPFKNGEKTTYFDGMYEDPGSDAPFALHAIQDAIEVADNAYPLDGGPKSPSSTAAAGSDVAGVAPTNAVDKLPDRVKAARDQYMKASESLGQDNPKDREAYELLEKIYVEQNKQFLLPKFSTWTSYLRQWRRATGQQKSKSRDARRADVGRPQRRGRSTMPHPERAPGSVISEHDMREASSSGDD